MKAKNEPEERFLKEPVVPPPACSELEMPESAPKLYTDTLFECDRILRVIFDSIGEAITVTDLEGRIIEANESTVRNSGYRTKDELLGRSGLEFIAEKDRAKCIEDLLKALKTGKTKTEQYTFIDKNGREYQGWAKGTLIHDDDGNPVGFINVAMDLSEVIQAQDALKESEERYRKLVDNANEAIVVAQDGILKFGNPKASEMTGCPAAELSKRPFTEFIHPDDREMVVDRHLRRLKGERIPQIYPLRIIDREGNTKWIEINAVLIEWEGRPATLNFLTDITDRKQAEEAIQFYVSKITTAQEEERKRIARELHDETIQNLAALMVELDVLTGKIGQLPQNTIDHLKGLREQAKSILLELRRFSTELRPALLDQLGLAAALDWLCESTGDNIAANLVITGTEQRLSPEIELALFRITQEALSNVKKHASAREVLVEIDYGPDRIELNIVDDGEGFRMPEKLSELAAKGCSGIMGMQERARIVNGTISLDSKTGKGTKVSVRVPICSRSY